MSSESRIAANQANAQHSTGPRTSEGKAASSANNLHLGFRSQTVLLPGDDPADYQALLDQLTAHFDPRHLSDYRFIREMANAEWRLQRVRSHMTAAIARRIDDLAPHHPAASPDELQSLALETLAVTGCSYGTWLRYETKFERQYDRAYREWSRDQTERLRSQQKEALATVKKVLKCSALSVPAPGLASTVQNTSRPDPIPAIARNAPCPCGSGDKYKRCCGPAAPPLLGQAA